MGWLYLTALSLCALLWLVRYFWTESESWYPTENPGRNLESLPVIPGLTPEEVQQTIDEAEREVGLQVAELVEVQDGWYTERVELIVPQYLKAAYFSEETPITEVSVIPHVVTPLDKPEPRYKNEVRWKKV